MFRESEFISGGAVKKFAAVLASLILAFSAIFTFSNVAVSNASVVYSNSIYDRIPVQTIVLDSDFTKNNLLLSSASGDYKYYNGGSYTAVYLNGTINYGERWYPSGSITLRRNNCGYDADGSRVDAVVTINNAYVEGTRSSVSYPSVFTMYGHAVFADSRGLYDQDDSDYGRFKVRFNISCSFYKTGTSTPASGTFMSQVLDIDANNSALSVAGSYDETLDMMSGVSNVYMQNNCNIAVSGNGISFSGTGLSGTNGWDAGLVYSAGSSHTLRWWGSSRCGTKLLVQFQTYKIVASSGTGGSISSPGTTVVGYGGSKTYTMTPQPGYTVADVKVDGVSVGKRTSYTFSAVKANHTIHVDWRPLGIVAVSKRTGDTSLSVTNRYSLAGAQYTLYTNAACTTLAKDCNGRNVVLTTNAQGQARTGNVIYDGTYYLKETKASPGYRLDSTVHRLTVSNGSTASASSTEPPQRGAIKVAKKSAIPEWTEGNDRYSLAGAVYKVYRDGSEVATLTTDANGNTSSFTAPLGTYTVKETVPSKGFRLDEKTYTIDVSADNQSETVNSVEEPQRGAISLSKSSASPSWTQGNGCYSLEGATYSLDFRGTRFAEMRTGADGRAAAVMVPLGVFSVKETSPSTGYRLDEETYTVDISTDNQSENVDSTEVPLVDDYPLKLHKLDFDAERTGHGDAAQGGLSLSGATYSVKYYDGYYSSVIQTAPLAPKWEKSYTTSIDGTGQAIFDVPDSDKFLDGAQKAGWPLGTYVIEETRAPFGYRLDASDPYIMQITKASADTGESDTVVGRNDTSDTRISESNAMRSSDELMRADLAIMKFGEPSTDPDENPDVKVPQQGVRFEIYNESLNDVYRVDAGTWAAPGELVYTIETDEQGYASTEDIAVAAGTDRALPCGTYRVHEVPESTVPGYAPMPDATLTVSVPGRVYRWMIENKVGTPLLIAKMDFETGKQVRGHTKFSLLDSNKNTVTMGLPYPSGAVQSVFETDITGSVILPEKLMPGQYFIKEAQAPEGYALNPELVPFTVDSSTVSTWDNPFRASVSDKPAKGIITVNNTDSETGAKITASSSVIEVRAKSDIVTPDGTLRAKQGEVVYTGTTSNGTFDTPELYLGNYEIVQREAPDGYILNRTVYSAELSYQGDSVEVVRTSADIPNAPQKGKLGIVLDDRESSKPILTANGTFMLVAAEDIATPDGTVRHRKGDIVETVSIDGTGTANTLDEHYIGRYEFVESSAPYGYVIDRSPVPAEISPDPSGGEHAIGGRVEHSNVPQKGHIAVEKLDAETGRPVLVAGALFDIIAAEDIYTGDGTMHFPEGQKVASVETGPDGRAVTGELLYLGKYEVREATAPQGYMLSAAPSEAVLAYAGQELPMTDTAEGGVSVRNMPAKGSVHVQKKDIDTKRNLLEPGILIDIIAAEDIVTPDGTVHWHKGDTVASLPTDETGHASAEGLYVGHYQAIEKTAPGGYLVNPMPEDFSVEYADGENEPVPSEVEILDEPVKGSVSVEKVDGETGKHIVHDKAVFAVYAKHDIYTADGTKRASENERVAEIATIGGHAEAAGLFPGTYIISELDAPYGYIADEHPVEVTIGMSRESADVAVTVENLLQKGTISINKKDEESEKNVLASKTVFDVIAADDIVAPDGTVIYEKGTIVETVETDENGNAFVKDVPIGRYEIVEKIPPTGYALNPEPVEASLSYEEDGGLVDVSVDHYGRMPRGSLSIEKVSALDASEKLEGAMFALYAAEDVFSGDGEVHLVAGEKAAQGTTGEAGELVFEDLRQGKYRLVEESAPAGYIEADETEVDIAYLWEPGAVEEEQTEVPTASEPDGTETDGGSIESCEAPDNGQAGRTDIPKIEVRLIVEDPPIELVVSKVDENGDLLGGCELSLHEWDGSSDGNIGEEISTWTSSGDAAETITGIEPGRYVLVEDAACDGYDLAVPVEFEVAAQSEPNQVEMVNKKSAVADEEINISEPEPPSFIEEVIAATGGMPVLGVLASVSAVAAFATWLAMRRKKI